MVQVGWVANCAWGGHRCCTRGREEASSEKEERKIRGDPVSSDFSSLGPRDGDGVADEVMPRTACHPHIHFCRQQHRSRALEDRTQPRRPTDLLSSCCAASVDSDAAVALANEPAYSISARNAIRKAFSTIVRSLAAPTRLNEVLSDDRREALLPQRDAVAHHRAADVGRHDHLRCGPTAALLHPVRPCRPRHLRSAGTLTANLLLAGGERSDRIRRRAVIPALSQGSYQPHARPCAASAERCAWRVSFRQAPVHCGGVVCVRPRA
jgi:hypothetical protein